MADYPGLPHTRFSSGNIAQTLTSSSQSPTIPRNAVFVAKIATYLCLCDTNSPQNSTINLSWSDHKTVKILSASRQGTSSHYQKSYLDLRFWYSVFVNSSNIYSNIRTAMLSIWNKSWESMLDSIFLHITNNAQHWGCFLWYQENILNFQYFPPKRYDIGPFSPLRLYLCTNDNHYCLEHRNIYFYLESVWQPFMFISVLFCLPRTKNI